VQSFKIILGALQSYVSLRLISIQWPDIVLRMFDFTRFFTFSFDIIRPECTVTYSPQSKLLFVLIGPLVCCFLSGLSAVSYATFKSVRMSSMLRKYAAHSPYSALDWSFFRTLKSVGSCLFVSAFVTKFGKSRMLTDGVLWYALDPSLAIRTDITVVKQRLRRSAVTPNLKGSFWVHGVDQFTHLLLPTLALVLIGFAGYTRYSRASMLEVLNQDFIRTARAKGINERTVIMRHAFRNAMIPLTTLVAFDFAGVIGGAVITEKVFAWSGMGSLFVESLRRVDVNPVMGFFLITGTVAILFNLIADIAYTLLDPRIRVN
jgi:hypothetical protein